MKVINLLPDYSAATDKRQTSKRDVTLRSLFDSFCGRDAQQKKPSEDDLMTTALMDFNLQLTIRTLSEHGGSRQPLSAMPVCLKPHLSA
jgi:hypothetical protein